MVDIQKGPLTTLEENDLVGIECAGESIDVSRTIGRNASAYVQ